MARKPVTRQTELADIKDIEESLLKVYEGIEKGFLDASDRINDILDYWDIANCKLNSKQYYNGNAAAYVPIVHDAIEARKTRFTNQIFPQTGKYIEVTTDKTELPTGMLALLEHYVRRAGLRASVIPTMFRTGDIEGQYNLYVSWQEITRHVTTREVKGPMVDGVQLDPEDVDEEDQIEDVTEEEVKDFGPMVEVVSDNDVLILPAISNSIDEALYVHGGSVTILRRWSKSLIKQMISDKEIDKKKGEELIERMDGAKDNTRKDIAKAHVDDAGIKSGGKYALVYETWSIQEVRDGERRLTRTYFGGADVILSCRLNPYWCDLCPLISHPVDKMSGSIKGLSKISYGVDTLQYMANDFLNQGADSASYALLPIVMTDPISNPRVGSMVVDLAAVWEVDPDKTKFAQFPPLWNDAMALVAALTQQIFQTLGVNPSMIPQRAANKKPTQAEVASEQQVDLLTTADVVIPLEDGILTPMLRRFVEYDAQFRRDDLWVESFGREGMRSGMELVPPQQRQNRVTFKWWGVEQARSERQMQMMVAGMNVLRQIPPQQLGGRIVDMVPLVERYVEATYGPRLAPLIFRPLSDTIGMPPEEENSLMIKGIELPVSPVDDDRKHLMVHSQLMQNQVPPGIAQVVRAHMFKHQQQIALKNAAAAQQQAGGPPPGARPQQGGGQSRPGAATSVPRDQGPPGMVHSDQMPLGMPRKAGATM